MTEQTVNIPLLRKAVEWAEAEAAKPWALSEWNQGWYRDTPERVTDTEWINNEAVTLHKSPDCGTCFCIAGWITEQTLTPDLHFEGGGYLLADETGRTVDDAQSFAARQLGLSRASDHLLFEGGNTIEEVRRIAESIAGERL